VNSGIIYQEVLGDRHW